MDLYGWIQGREVQNPLWWYYILGVPQTAQIRAKKLPNGANSMKHYSIYPEDCFFSWDNTNRMISMDRECTEGKHTGKGCPFVKMNLGP